MSETLETWMLFNPGICYLQKCLMTPDAKQQAVYHCQIHGFTHKCQYIADQRWGPNFSFDRFSGYTCPTEFDEETGTITCKLTGHVLDRGQPEYLCTGVQAESILQPGEDVYLNFQNNDAELLQLFLNFNIEPLVQLFAPIHRGVLSEKEQEWFVMLLAHREQQAKKTLQELHNTLLLQGYISGSQAVQRSLEA